ncbi:MAG: flagellar biosynthesis protein FlhF [Betaproteobacteria bacterium]|nr:flagellar biosynthesis protein FlhF [Betaproteobacteria bacterium]
MTPQKFVGATSREVLQKVKQALGDDALIVANRPFGQGIEVTALAASALAGTPRPRSRVAADGGDASGVVAHLMRELGAMKAMMQRELSGVAWSSLTHLAPARAAMMRRLLDAGFSPALARELIAVVAENAAEPDACKAVGGEIERRLPLAERESLVEQGGVYALVGPTGVGKTTTIAKLAARCVVRRGGASLALLTTDSYRIAAHDQLRVYGKILNVPVHAIKDTRDLAVTLAQLRDKKTILIDTIGMSQRDQLLAEQTALLTGCDAPIRRLLLLNATANAATLDEVIGAYAKGGIHGCIITKVDESAGVATALDAAIRHGLAVHYVTNGQRVPEDLHLPNRTYLLHRALQPIKDGAAHSLRADELPLVMAARGAAHG